MDTCIRGAVHLRAGSTPRCLRDEAHWYCYWWSDVVSWTRSVVWDDVGPSLVLACTGLDMVRLSLLAQLSYHQAPISKGRSLNPFSYLLLDLRPGPWTVAPRDESRLAAI